MNTAAHQRAQRFTWNTILEKMNGYYDEVLGHPSSVSVDRPADRPAAVH
jgi:hypothetical protein